MTCEYCEGRAYTKEPFTVITRYGLRIELAFDYCPKCGRRIKPLLDTDSLPDYEAEARNWEDSYNQARDKNEYLCKELEKMKMALDKKSAELEEKQHECDILQASTIKLEGQVEAYKFCIEHRRDR